MEITYKIRIVFIIRALLDSQHWQYLKIALPVPKEETSGFTSVASTNIEALEASEILTGIFRMFVRLLLGIEPQVGPVDSDYEPTSHQLFP